MSKREPSTNGMIAAHEAQTKPAAPAVGSPQQIEVTHVGFRLTATNRRTFLHGARFGSGFGLHRAESPPVTCARMAC